MLSLNITELKLKIEKEMNTELCDLLSKIIETKLFSVYERSDITVITDCIHNDINLPSYATGFFYTYFNHEYVSDYPLITNWLFTQNSTKEMI
jgi:hypothetical protein